MSVLVVVFVIVTMSSVGLPGTNGFIGEFMILTGTYVSDQLSVWERVFAFFASTGVILAAVYMLHAVLKMFWGPLENKANMGLADLNRREIIALSPLVFLIFWMGIFPASMLDSMRPTVTHFVEEYDARWREAFADDTSRLIPAAAPEGEEAAEPEEEGAEARLEGAAGDVLALAGGAR